MQSQQVKAFKNELRNYNYYLSRVTTLKNSIQFCYDRLGGLRAIDVSKEPTHSPPNKDYEYKLRDDIESYEQLLRHTQAQINYLDEILSRIENELRNAIKSIYIEGKQMRYVAMTLYISHGGLQKRIDKAIEKALD